MRSRSFPMAILSLALVSSALSAGCGDNKQTTTTTSGTGAAGGNGGSGESGGSGGDTGGSGGSSTGGASGGTGTGGSAAVPEVVVAFDPQMGQFVEGLDIHGGIAYVGALPTGQVFQVDLASPAIKPFGATPQFAQNGGALVGLTVGKDGSLYAALNITDPKGPKTGIYRIDAAGGDAKLVASDPGMVFCNDLHFDAAGDLFVSDSVSGTIFKIANGDGAVTKWAADPLLAPDPKVCNVDTQFHLGVNGFVRKDDAYFAVNTDKASIVKIPVGKDGSAGAPEVFFASDCATLSGADGLTLDPKTGDLIIAVNYQNKILRVTMDKKVTVLAQGEPLESPASLAVDGSDLYITSAAFEALAKDPTKAKPSLTKLPLD